MKYTWDPAKNAANIRKHAIDFIDAAKIFDGEIYERLDERFDYGEERWIAIGIAKESEIFVVYVEERAGEERRIISARPATRRERELYWQSVGKPN